MGRGGNRAARLGRAGRPHWAAARLGDLHRLQEGQAERMAATALVRVDEHTAHAGRLELLAEWRHGL